MSEMDASLTRPGGFDLMRKMMSTFSEKGVMSCSTEVPPVEDKICLGNERKEIKPSTSNKRDSQVDGEDNVTNAMPNNS